MNGIGYLYRQKNSTGEAPVFLPNLLLISKMKKTALNAYHHRMGGKMVEFAGFDMPVQFEGVNIEHETVRKALGVFDVSHMGEFRVTGKGL